MIADGEDNDRSSADDSDGAADIDAGHAGHHQIDDGKVRRPFMEHFQTLFRVVGGADLVALRSQCGAQDSCDLCFVVNYQNSFLHS